MPPQPPPSLRPLLEKRACLGTFVGLQDPFVTGLAGVAGADFILIDSEHTPMDAAVIQRHITTAAAMGIPAMVRVRELSRGAVQHALESGATGILVPLVETGEQARQLAKWCRYPPDGNRGMHSLTPASGYGSVPAAQYPSFANDRVLVAVQVETARGLASRVEISIAEGVDIVFAGPGDLALSMGVKPDSVEVLKAVDAIIEAGRMAGRITGVFAPTPAGLMRAKDAGARFLVLGSDAGMLSTTMKSSFEQARAAMGIS